MTVGYRDDREGLRQRNDDLEQELVRARAEIQKLKGRLPDAIDVARPSPPPGRPDRPALAIASLTMGAGALAVAAEMTGVPVALALLPLVFTITTLMLLSRVVVLAGPNEAVVLSGVSRKRADGTSVGYRVVHAGRAIRMPIFEVESRMDLGLFVVDVVVFDVAFQGGAVAELRLGACAKIDSAPAVLDRAVERFLGRDAAELEEVVREATIAAARQVCARLSLGDARRKPEPIAAAIREEVDHELSRIGLTLWTLELFSVEGGREEA